MQNLKKLAIDSQSLTCSKISFSKSAFNGNGQHYRGITESGSGSKSSVSFESYSINTHNDHNQDIDSSFYVPSKLKSSPSPQALNGKSKSCGMIKFSLNSPSSFSSKSYQPLNITLTCMDIEQTEPEISYTKSMDLNILQAPASLVETTSSIKYCNELNSYLVDKLDCIQVMDMLNNILSHYNDDIEFKIDYENKRIDGLVFISNHCVCFIIYIWESEDDTKQTKFEFRRASGDSLASAKFWSQIKTLFNKQQQPQQQHDDEVMDFISLDLDLGSMKGDDDDDDDDDEQHLSKSELDELTQSLVENDLFVVDELIFLYESMRENKSVCVDVLSHHKLMQQLINSSVLNEDVCVSRIAILILEELSQIPNHNMSMTQDYQLFNNMNLLLNHQRQLIKKYTIRLLSRLSDNGPWRINEISRNQMIENIKKYQTEFADHLNEEIYKINQKLMMK